MTSRSTGICRYCAKNVESYANAWQTATFNRWGYSDVTLRICGCKGIDPLNNDPAARKAYVVYGNYGHIVGVNPYTDQMLQKSAELSDDMVYRYKLSRIWNPTGKKILFIMINPSTADAAEDDRTIRLLYDITKLWNYDGFYVGNLYPFRSSKPADLKTHTTPEAIHQKNIASITEMAADSALVVYAWGTKGPDPKQKEPEWLKQIMLSREDRNVYTIGTTTKHIPKHPNQWRPNVTPIPDTPILLDPMYR